MNLQELLDRLDQAGRIKPARLRDVRSAINRYARMLGCGDPGECPERVFALPRARRNQLIEESLKDASPHVLRNVKNNVSFVLRGAEELGLIRPIRGDGGEGAPKQFGRRKIGARFPALVSASDVGYHRAPYSLPLERWPPNLKRQYDEWERWVTEAEVPKHYPNPRNRRATVENKTRKFEAFFGYLFNERGTRELDFEMLTDVEAEPPGSGGSKFRQFRKDPNVGLLQEFVTWHRERRLSRDSTQAREVVSASASVARRFYFLKARLAGLHEDAGRFDLLSEEINKLRAALDERQPPQIVRAGRGTVDREELLKAARAEFPQPNRQSAQSSGAELAARAGRALAILMMVHHPLRNSYYRRARIGRELVKKKDGKWHLCPDEEEVAKGKAGEAGRAPREQQLSPEVVGYLEAYLLHWRPKLVRKIEDRISLLGPDAGGRAKLIKELGQHKELLFLHAGGGPLTRAGFAQWIQSATYRWLGVRVNPESVREISLRR